VSSFRLFDLNPEQYRAATHGEGPLLILAGAGTGKTRVLTARIAWLVAQGTDPASILAVTFTNKAAKEMRERVGGMVNPDQAKEITLSTFHSLCVRMLRRHAHLLGYKENFSIFDESDQMGLMKKLAARIHDKENPLDPNFARHVISKAKAWVSANRTNPARRSAASSPNIRTGSVRSTRWTSTTSCSTPVSCCATIPRPARSGVPATVTSSWTSSRDTNKLQLELVSLLAGEERPNICVVGDDDQSIYGWRGAEASNLLEFERHFPDPEVIKLEQNYRSTDVILKVANRLIKNNARRRGKNLWSNVKEGEVVRILSATDDKTEAEFIADEIQASGPQSAKARPWTDFAVLYRMNAQSRQFEEVLRERRIPYRVVGGKSFFDRREVKDVVAYLGALLNPDDDNALLRVLANPPRGIGAATLQLATEAGPRTGRDFSPSSTTRSIWRSAPRAREARSSASPRSGAPTASSSRHRAPTLLPSSDRFWKSAVTSRISKKLQDRGGGRQPAGKRPGATQCPRRLLRKHPREGARGFLDGLMLEQKKEEEKAEERDGVTLITLHAAKGLEYSQVWLVGAEEGLLPHTRSKDEGTVDEERRLLYVGITRARHRLTITHCATRRKFGTTISCTPSSFLKELEGEGVESGSMEEILTAPLEESEILDGFAQMRAMLNS